MTVIVGTDRIALHGHCTVEDAEPLLAALLDHPGFPVDISELSHAHLAIVQLLYAKGHILGSPASDFLSSHALGGLIDVAAQKIGSS